MALELITQKLMMIHKKMRIVLQGLNNKHLLNKSYRLDINKYIQK